MNDAICVRDITREPSAMATCISGSKCVTRLIKILRDLLRRTERVIERDRKSDRRREEKGWRRAVGRGAEIGEAMGFQRDEEGAEKVDAEVEEKESS